MAPKWHCVGTKGMPLFRRRREDEDEPVHPPQRGYDWYKDRKPIPNG